MTANRRPGISSNRSRGSRGNGTVSGVNSLGKTNENAESVDITGVVMAIFFSNLLLDITGAVIAILRFG
jgi:hypothetical protein